MWKWAGIIMSINSIIICFFLLCGTIAILSPSHPAVQFVSTILGIVSGLFTIISFAKDFKITGEKDPPIEEHGWEITIEKSVTHKRQLLTELSLFVMSIAVVGLIILLFFQSLPGDDGKEGVTFPPPTPDITASAGISVYSSIPGTAKVLNLPYPVSIRTSPDEGSSSNIIKTVSAGTEFKYVRQITTWPHGAKWHEVVFNHSGGTSAYIKSDCLSDPF